MNDVAVSPEVIGPVSWGGLQAHCLGYVLDNRSYGQLIYLSLVGFRTAVRGIWAALMGNRWLEVDGRSIHRAPVKYQRITTRLLEQGLDHLSVDSSPGHTLKFIEPRKPFYVLSEAEKPPLARARQDHAGSSPPTVGQDSVGERDRKGAHKGDGSQSWDICLACQCFPMRHG